MNQLNDNQKALNHHYNLLSIKTGVEFDYYEFKEKFGYNPTFFNGKKKFKFESWNSNTISMIIDDILNNTNYSLVSVSEDSEYMRYHFVS